VTSLNTLVKPILFIDGREENSLISGKVNFPGNNGINTLSAVISDVEKEERSVLGKKIELYLNYDNNDGLPVFRGFITSYQPTGDKISIKASDPRIYLTSQMSPSISLTEEDNYDGYSLAQFLNSYITNYINIDETKIGLDMLQDTEPPISLKDIRQEKINPYDLVTSKLQEIVNKEGGLDDSRKFYCIMIEGNDNSNITFTKRKSLNSTPSFTFSGLDGIQNISYTKRNAPNTAFVSDGEHSSTFKYGNRPKGIFSKEIGYTSESKIMKGSAVLERRAMESILVDRSEISEISLDINKGIHIGLESLISIESGHFSHKDKYIVGNHVVVGKTINFSDSRCNVQLELNKPKPILSDYIIN
jgi:hypothetical protein